MTKYLTVLIQFCNDYIICSTHRFRFDSLFFCFSYKAHSTLHATNVLAPRASVEVGAVGTLSSSESSESGSFEADRYSAESGSLAAALAAAATSKTGQSSLETTASDDGGSLPPPYETSFVAHRGGATSNLHRGVTQSTAVSNAVSSWDCALR